MAKPLNMEPINRKSGSVSSIPPRLFTALGLICCVFFLSAGLTTFGSEQSGEPLHSSRGLHFSMQPADSEIFQARVFEEPLIPDSNDARTGENQALANALIAYSTRLTADDFSSLTMFLAQFPDSRWQNSLLLHLGTEYYNNGYYSKALASWEQAWQHLKDATDPKIKPQA